MKPKKLNKKLSLRKVTIAGLDNKEQKAAKGGYYVTDVGEGCYTWHPHPVCITQPFPCWDTLPGECR